MRFGKSISSFYKLKGPKKLFEYEKVVKYYNYISFVFLSYIH